MEIPRISPTVIDVPKDLFSYCFANLNPPAEEPKEDFYSKDTNKCLSDEDIYDIIKNGGTPRSALNDDVAQVRATRDKRQVRRKKKKGGKGEKKRKKQCLLNYEEIKKLKTLRNIQRSNCCECKKPKKKLCPPRCKYPKDDLY